MALSGFTRVCGLMSGGMKTLYIVEKADVTSFTLSTTYTTATMVSGKVFKKYEFEQDSFELKEDVTVENNVMKVMHSIEFYLSKLTATSQAAVSEIALAAACGLVAIAEDSNGTKWVVGYSENFLKERCLELKSSKMTTGKKLGDANGTTITLESEDNSVMISFTGTIPV